MTDLKTISLNQKNSFIIASLALLVLALSFAQFSNFDVALQNNFFDFTQKKWLVDKDEPRAKFFFYQLPKILLGLAIIFSLAASFFAKNRQKFFLIFLGLALIPFIAGNVKKFTNIYCPTQLEIYGGDKPYVKIFDSYPKNFVQKKNGQCFPAGHAVSGFCLFILFFALQKKSHKIFVFMAALIWGWALGLYQMLKGAHFFSDTLVAMLLCFLLAAVISRLYETHLAKSSLKN